MTDNGIDYDLSACLAENPQSFGIDDVGRLHGADLPVVPVPKPRREFDTTMTITSWARARPARHIPEGDDA